MFKIKYSERAIKELEKTDPFTRKYIYSWIDKNLNNCENPRVRGKGLTADRSGEWRYRIGDYRLICLIEDNALVILALSIGRRKVSFRQSESQ